LFSYNVIKMLKSSQPLPEGTVMTIPRCFTVIARHEDESYNFQDIVPEIVEQVVGGIVFDFVSKDDAVGIRVELSFADERLKYNPIGGFGFTPNRTESKFIQYEIDFLPFFEIYFK